MSDPCEKCKEEDCTSCPMRPDEYGEEDDSNCGALDQQLFSFGSEECEFCVCAEECRGATIQHESFGKKEASPNV